MSRYFVSHGSSHAGDSGIIEADSEQAAKEQFARDLGLDPDSVIAVSQE